MSDDETASAGESRPPEPEDAAASASDAGDELAEQVAAYDEDLANDVAELISDLAAHREQRDDLQDRIEELEEMVDDRTERLQRVQAEFQNFKKRTERQREERKARATEDLIERLLDVRDNLDRALSADGDIRDGVEATLRSFDEVLSEEGVERIDPEPGTTVDPRRHEVMLRVQSEQPTETVAEVYRPGYEMGEKVLRPAQITVSDDEDADDS